MDDQLELAYFDAEDGYDNPEYKVPETMFIWGNYPLRANSDGFYGHWVVDLMKRGKLHPIRRDAKYKLFLRSEVTQRWSHS